MNYYELLEVSSTASAEVIKNAYKTLAKKYHPDTYKGDSSFAEEKMKLLNEAIAILSDEEKRADYDSANGINLRREGSTVFTASEKDDDYIKGIDEFLSSRKAKKATHAEDLKEKPKPAQKPAAPLVNMDKEAVDFIKNAALYDIAGIDEFKTPSTLSHSEPEIDEDSFDEVYDSLRGNNRKGQKKPLKKKAGAWFYITVSLLVIINITLVVLIMRSFNLSNLKSMLSGNGSTPAIHLEDESENVVVTTPAGNGDDGLSAGLTAEPTSAEPIYQIPPPDTSSETATAAPATERETAAPTTKKPEPATERPTQKKPEPTTRKPAATTQPETTTEAPETTTAEPVTETTAAETSAATEQETIAVDVPVIITPEAELTTEELPPQPE